MLVVKYYNYKQQSDIWVESMTRWPLVRWGIGENVMFE